MGGIMQCIPFLSRIHIHLIRHVAMQRIFKSQSILTTNIHIT
jgi:hypothetical protein